MSLHKFLLAKVALLWTFVLMPLIPSLSASEVAASEQPNVLILYADDLGYGDFRMNNPDSKIPMPNLERLATEGMRFTDGHSSSGICSPSRYALLTGRYHWRDFHNIVGVFGPSRFETERLTLPELMGQNGYRTACVGKWHLGWNWDAIKNDDARPIDQQGRRQVWGPRAFDWTRAIPDGPLAHGFDYYFGDTVINFPPYCWIENDRVVTPPDTLMDTSKWKPIKEGNWECRSGPMVSDWDPYENIPTLTRKGVEFIRAQRESDRPFFLYFAFPSPHAPIIPNDQFDGKSNAGPYGDFVYETDHAVGKLLAALAEASLEENTIVIFTADNGPERYAYQRDQKFDHWSSNPYRGLKRDIYEGGHHVPFVVKWPGVVRPGATSDALVSQIDIMATLAAVLNSPLPDHAAEDSHNLLPVWKGQREDVRTTHVHNTYARSYAIRDGKWLLIDAEDGYVSGRNRAWEQRHGYPRDNDLPVELYDLSTDAGQRDNIAATNPNVVDRLKSLLMEIRSADGSAPRLR